MGMRATEVVRQPACQNEYQLRSSTLMFSRSPSVFRDQSSEWERVGRDASLPGGFKRVQRVRPIPIDTPERRGPCHSCVFLCIATIDLYCYESIVAVSRKEDCTTIGSRWHERKSTSPVSLGH